jgi:IS5 family transposase
MMPHRRLQRRFGDGWISEEVLDLREPWMRQADALLDDETLLHLVQPELSRRSKKSKTGGRHGMTAEVVLRMRVLKHLRHWSFAVLTREVRANLVYREFTRVGGGTVPDDKTRGRLARQRGAERIAEIHQRGVAIAQQKQVVTGRKMRVDTTVVETHIHYPTDSSLRGDGVRVLTRAMKKVTALAGAVGTRWRDRTRSAGWRREIGRASRSRGQQTQEKLRQGYRKLLDSTSRVVTQAERFSAGIAAGVKKSADVFAQAAWEGLKKELDTMAPRVEQLMRSTRDRIFRGVTASANKIVSLFEPTTEIIRKGKAGKPTEFGKLVRIQEAENQIITCYEVYDQRPSDSDLLVPAIEQHHRPRDRVPRTAAADAGFYSARNEAAAQQMGVQNAQRWGTGGRPHQCPQAAPRFEPLPLQGTGGDETVGRARRHCRYAHQPRPGFGDTARTRIGNNSSQQVQ